MNQCTSSLLNLDRLKGHPLEDEIKQQQVLMSYQIFSDAIAFKNKIDSSKVEETCRLKQDAAYMSLPAGHPIQ